jgi:predicted ABC-type exoprotein transport system permease subunit
MVDVKSIGRQVRDNVVADLLGKAVVALLVLGLGALFLAVRSNASAPIWILVVALSLGTGVVFVLVRDRAKHEDLAWFAVEIQEQYLQHLAHTLHTCRTS